MNTILPVSDSELIVGWQEFREILRSLSKQAPRVYIDFASHRLIDGSKENPLLFGYRYLMDDLVRELINSLNKWSYSIPALMAWSHVLEKRSAQERIELLWEFVDPLAESILGAPYRFKQHLIYAASRAIDFLQPEQAPIGEKDINYKSFKHAADGMRLADALVHALGTLSTPDFEAATDDFRNRFQHRVTPGIELGQRALVTRFVEPNGIRIGFGSSQPASLTMVLPHLESELQRAIAAFEIFWTLARDIELKLDARRQ